MKSNSFLHVAGAALALAASAIIPCQAETLAIPELDTKGDVYKTEGPNDPLIYDSAVGRKKVIMLYVDFPDAEMDKETTERAEKVLGGEKFGELFEQNSYGKLSFDIEHVHGWRRLSKSHKKYSSKTTEAHRDLFVEIFTMYPKVDFLAYEYIMANMPRIGNTAFGERDEIAIPYKGKKINVALNISSASPYVLAHEAAHCMGLPDLYSYGDAKGPKNPTGPWDIMSAAGRASGFLGWHRHKLKWLDADRKTYVTEGKHQFELTPLNAASGVSMIAIPVDDPAKPSKVFVVELAQPFRNLGRVGTASGVLVYSVDATLASGQNSVVVYPKGDLSLNAPFLPGDRFEHEDAPVSVKVLKKNDDGSYSIEVEVKDRKPKSAGVEGETEHFWYRLAPADPYIDSQRDNLAFGFGDGTILLSEDNGKTWPHTAEFPNARNITFSCLLENGNIVFATRTKLYLSTDKLKTFRQITVKDRDGSDYVPHTPRNANQSGWYFHSLDGVHTWDVDGTEMLVWGNYCNVIGGSVPVNIYYSTDQGQTVKIAYSFGRNPRYTDGGTPLGDPDNPVICRHIHSVAYNPKENAFYACTGDHDLKSQHECHWLRGLYDRDKDTWNWKVLVSTDSNTRYKSGGINFVDGKVYWAADANGKIPHDRGIFRCDPADIATPSKHTLLFNPKFESANMIIEDGVILSAHYAPASPYHTGLIISPDMGKTWAQYDLKQFGKRSPLRFQKRNSDGWFRVDLRKGWIERGEVLFIKPK